MDNDNEEALAQTIGFLITVGIMLMVFISAMLMGEWAIAGVAIFFAILMWSFSYHQIKEYYNGQENRTGSVHQTDVNSDR